jgi:hypothetical protein
VTVQRAADEVAMARVRPALQVKLARVLPLMFWTLDESIGLTIVALGLPLLGRRTPTSASGTRDGDAARPVPAAPPPGKGAAAKQPGPAPTGPTGAATRK